MIIPLVFCFLILLAKDQAIQYAQWSWWILLSASFLTGAFIHIFYTKPMLIPAPEESQLYQLYPFLFLPFYQAIYISGTLSFYSLIVR